MRNLNKDEHKLVAYEHGHIANMNIFRPVRRGRAQGVIVEGTCGSAKLKVMMFWQLSNEDEDLLLLIYSLARPFHHSVELKDGKLRDELLPKGSCGIFQGAKSISFKITKYTLCKQQTKSVSLKAYSNLNSAMERLATTSISYENSKKKGLTHLLSYCSNEVTGELTIAINPLSAAILLGEKVSYIKYDLDDRFQLKAGIPRRLHSILSGSLTKGKGSINLHLLVQKIYGEKATADKIRAVKRGLEELKSLDNWSVNINGRGPKAIVYYANN